MLYDDLYKRLYKYLYKKTMRKLSEKNIRKLIRLGGENGSLALTIPKEMVTELGWREKQKIVVNQRGKKLVVKDWKK